MLRLATNAAGYVGSFSVQADSTRVNINVEIAGAVQADGSVILTGRRADTEMRRLRLARDPVTGLRGAVDYSIPPFSVTAEILSASGYSTATWAARPFEGNWVGNAVLRSCLGCADTIGRGTGIALMLAQHGDTVEGSGYFTTASCGTVAGPCWISLNGVVTAQSLSLSGELTAPVPFPSSADDHVKLARFTAAVDSLGRMQGTFSYEADGRRGNRRYEYEIVWLERQP